MAFRYPSRSIHTFLTDWVTHSYPKSLIDVAIYAHSFKVTWPVVIVVIMVIVVVMVVMVVMVVTWSSNNLQNKSSWSKIAKTSGTDAVFFEENHVFSVTFLNSYTQELYYKDIWRVLNVEALMKLLKGRFEAVSSGQLWNFCPFLEWGRTDGTERIVWKT